MQTSSGIFTRFRYLWLSCRPHQWIKNTFLYLPLLFSGHLFDPIAWQKSTIAFIAFCAASSGVYLWNDVADRAQDKNHPFNRLRPIASGKLPVQSALIFCAILVATALLIAFKLDRLYGAVVGLYVGLNLVYTRWLRGLVLLDVFSIAAFFVFRVVGAFFVLRVDFSYWMLILISLLALFLALNKRRFELVKLAKKTGHHRRVLKEYTLYLIDQLCAAICGAVIVTYSIFTINPEQVLKFGSHNMVFTIPFVCYGLFRYQYLVLKRGRGGDPAEIVVSDRPLLWNIVFWAIVCSLAIYTKRDWISPQVIS